MTNSYSPNSPFPFVNFGNYVECIAERHPADLATWIEREENVKAAKWQLASAFFGIEYVEMCLGKFTKLAKLPPQTEEYDGVDWFVFPQDIEKFKKYVRESKYIKVYSENKETIEWFMHVNRDTDVVTICDTYGGVRVLETRTYSLDRWLDLFTECATSTNEETRDVAYMTLLQTPKVYHDSKICGVETSRYA